MIVEFYQIRWGNRDWYWCVTSGHISAAGRHQDAAAAALEMANGIRWVIGRASQPKTSDKEFCFQPSADRV